MALTVDTRTASEYGVVRTFSQVDIQFSTLGGGQGTPSVFAANLGNNTILDNAGGGSAFAETIFIQFAGFTLGRSQSAFSTPWAGNPGNIMSALISSSNSSLSMNDVSTPGSSETAFRRRSVPRLRSCRIVRLCEPVDTNYVAGTYGNAYGGQHVPDFVGNVKVDQAWGMFKCRVLFTMCHFYCALVKITYCYVLTAGAPPGFSASRILIKASAG